MSDNHQNVATTKQDADSRRDILINAGVFARDPSAHPGLSLRLDPSIGLDPVFRPIGYDTRHTTGVMVHCSICAQKQEHHDGAIVKMRDGRIGLVGNSCGKRHFFGDDGWVAITNRIREDEEMALFRARFGPAKDKLSRLEEMLKGWAKKLDQIDKLRNDFEIGMPNLATAVKRSVRDGALFVDRSREVSVVLPNGDHEMRTEYYQELACRLDAVWFFRGSRLAGVVNDARPKICQALGRLHHESTATNVAVVRRMLREFRESLENVAAMQSQLKSLSSDTLIAKFASWGNQSIKGRDSYSSNGSVMFRHKNGEEVASFDFAAFPVGLDRYWDDVLAAWPNI